MKQNVNVSNSSVVWTWIVSVKCKISSHFSWNLAGTKRNRLFCHIWWLHEEKRVEKLHTTATIFYMRAWKHIYYYLYIHESDATRGPENQTPPNRRESHTRENWEDLLRSFAGDDITDSHSLCVCLYETTNYVPCLRLRCTMRALRPPLVAVVVVHHRAPALTRRVLRSGWYYCWNRRWCSMMHLMSLQTNHKMVKI